MKKTILSFFAGMAVFALMAFATADSYQVTKKTAEVNQELGVFIFMDCYPVMQFEELGYIKSTSWSGTYEELKPKLVKKAKKQYPECEGIIIASNSGSCTVIKFKMEDGK